MDDDAQKLSADDARILALESAALTGHTLKVMVLAPGTPLDLEALRARVAEQLPANPRALEKVGVGSDGTARWMPAAHFDIDHHVRRRSGTECVDRDALHRVLGALMSEHLDRDRPLWTFDLIGPLADGSEVIAARMHHAMVDGIAGVAFLQSILFDLAELEPGNGVPLDAGAPATAHVPPGITPALETPAQKTPALAHLNPLGEWTRMSSAALRELAHPAWRSPFDKPVTASREVAFTSAPLATLKRIGASRPTRATVNDVLLAIVAGGMHEWLRARGTGRYLRAQVPVSLHHRDAGQTQLGNHDSFINVSLPIHEPDPLRRLDHISTQTRIEKQLGDAELLYDLFHAVGRMPTARPVVDALSGSAREFSVAISNVPGPRTPVSVMGRRIEQLFSSSEPGAHHALRIAAISNATEMGIGFCTDPTAVADVHGLADAAAHGYRELVAAALGAGFGESAPSGQPSGH